jgi:hypothetical protein
MPESQEPTVLQFKAKKGVGQWGHDREVGGGHSRMKVNKKKTELMEFLVHPS